MNENTPNPAFANTAADSLQGIDPAPETNGGFADQARQGATRVMDEVKARTSDARAQADEMFHRGEDYVRENPVPVVIGAFVAGLLVGLALSRRHEPTARERYVDEPLQQAKDLLYAALTPVAKQLQTQYGAVRSAGKKVADEIGDFDLGEHVHPIAEQARRWKFW